MNQDILLSKIVPNPTDTTWAQAYTTLNVYITLSIHNETSKNPVTPYGKELLEKLQREFFALDDKSLENIKKAVSNVSSTITEGYRYSILVGTIVKDILYIVIASEGQVVISRGSNTGVIATGVEGELHGFSGKLKHDDVVILESGDFAQKLPLSTISDYLTTHDVLQISENITPLIHEGSKGTESAIILQFKDLSGVEKTDEGEFEIQNDQEEPPQEEESTPSEKEHENLWTKPVRENRNIEELQDNGDEYVEERTRSRFSMPSIPFKVPPINFADRRVLIIIAVVILGTILVGGIVFQSGKQVAAKRDAEFTKIYQPAKEKYDHGESLEPLNKTLALADFNEAEQLVNSALKNFPEGSDEYKKLSDFKSQIEGKISSLGGGGSAKNVKDVISTGDKVKSITSITAKGGTLLLLDKEGEQVATIVNGTVKKTYNINSSDSHISADDKFIYTMGEGVTSIDRGNGKVTKIIKKVKGSALDIFGSNVYTLDSDDVLKYKAPTYDESSYFSDKPSFKSSPIDMSISGPILILEADGTIEHFTKGKKDDFSISGLQAPFATGAKIYADPEQDNMYVLDVKNQRVVVLTDKGDYQTQYEGDFIKDATSFAIDEKNKTGYVVTGNKIVSFDL